MAGMRHFVNVWASRASYQPANQAQTAIKPLTAAKPND